MHSVRRGALSPILSISAAIPPGVTPAISSAPAMPLRFGINGFGRIGRALLRIVLTREDLPSGLEPAAINDIVPAPVLARLLARDSVHGPFSLPVRAEGGALFVGDRWIPVFQEPDP